MFITFTSISLVTMVLVDYWLGPRAEFVNAWSVIERVFGYTPSAGESMVCQAYGATGEMVAVLLVNMLVGAILTVLIRWRAKS
jgi:hypothetical protein